MLMGVRSRGDDLFLILLVMTGRERVKETSEDRKPDDGIGERSKVSPAKPRRKLRGQLYPLLDYSEIFLLVLVTILRHSA